MKALNSGRNMKLLQLLHLSDLNMMEGILNKEQLAKVPSKTKYSFVEPRLIGLNQGEKYK